MIDTSNVFMPNSRSYSYTYIGYIFDFHQYMVGTFGRKYTFGKKNESIGAHIFVRVHCQVVYLIVRIKRKMNKLIGLCARVENDDRHFQGEKNEEKKPY